MARNRTKPEPVPAVITETQLIRVLDAHDFSGGPQCAANNVRLESVERGIINLGTKFDSLDEAIRGNGKIGLKAKVEAVEKAAEATAKLIKGHEDAHVKKHEKADMNWKWKATIIVTLFAIIIPSMLTAYMMFTEKARTAAAINQFVEKTSEILITVPPPQP
jgi:hypothetical protein